MKSIDKLLLFFSVVILPVMGCKKELNEKPNSTVLEPTTPGQLHGLLDNPEVFSFGHTLGLVSADEFYFTPDCYTGLPPTMQHLYTWEKYPFDSAEIHYDWKRFYLQIYYANIALEGVNRLIAASNGDRDLDKIKGDALFKRALAFYHLLGLFAPAYNKATAASDLGIPLKLKSEEEQVITRATVQVCYGRIVSDLKEAIDLLQFRPDPRHRNRASRVAAEALLARVHLCMSNWPEAALEAGAVLQRYDSLINYNNVDSSTLVPFPEDNKEVIYPLKAPEGQFENALVAALPTAGAIVDSNFIRSYNANDLRLTLYFHPRQKIWVVRPSYAGTFTPFEGICTSEVYLTLAESNARMGRQDTALFYLEKLLRNRLKTGAALNLPGFNQPDSILDRIISERKKELAFRGQRWFDIKRLNRQGSTIKQERLMGGQIITLGANDLRYALLLPKPTVSKYNLQQNPR